MNYAINEDMLCRNDGLRDLSLPSVAVSGVLYSVVEDLAQEPVDLAFFKSHCRVDYNTDDALMTSYLKAARQYLEQWSQRSFGAKTINFKALKVCKNYRLMFGPVDTIDSSDYEAFGDVLKGGPYMEVDFNFTTKGDGLPEAIKIAICRYGAGLYMQRENLMFGINGQLQEPDKIMDEAQKMVKPYANITFP